MKKFASLLVALMLVALLGCTAMAESVATVWTLTTMSFQGETLNAADVGMSMVFYLNEDGTGTAHAGNGEEDIDSTDCTWSQNGNIVTLTVDGEPVDFTLVDGTLVGELDGITMTLVPGAAEAGTVEEVPTVDGEITLEFFNGEWDCEKALYNGVTIPLSAAGDLAVSMTMENGEGFMVITVNGVTYDSIVHGVIKDVVLVEGEAAQTVLELTADEATLFSGTINMVPQADGSIQFLEANSGVTFILEKNLENDKDF
ncbi:MAG: hypothetical protein E7331_07100 [Clostridiales bacterium]|nr:hypothetical protein [Clostridiales bacterium]